MAPQWNLELFLKFNSGRASLFLHPTQWNKSKRIVAVATTDVCVCTDEPALFNWPLF
jgi:hypothetical protein